MTTATGLFLSLVAPFVCGLPYLNWMGNGRRREWLSSLGESWLVGALVLGAAHWLFRPNSAGDAWLILSIMCAVSALTPAIISLRLKWRNQRVVSCKRRAPERTRLSALTMAGLAIALSGLPLMEVLQRPLGYGDETNIWIAQARARADAIGPDDLKERLDTEREVAHADYPPLLPSLMAWILEIGQDPHHPGLRLPATCSYLALVFLLFGALKNRLGLLLGICLSLAVLTPQIAIWMRTVGMAEFLLAGYLLFATLSFIEFSRSLDWRSAIRLAFSITGLAATKNEGRLQGAIILSVALAFALHQLIRLRRRTLYRVAIIVALVGLPAPVEWGLLAERQSLGLSNDLMTRTAGRSDLFTTLADQWQQRFWFTLNWLATEVWWNPRQSGLLWVIFSCLLVSKLQSRIERGVLLMSAVLIAIAAAFVLVYLGTPRDLIWHLETSAARIYWVLLPSVALVVAELLNDRHRRVCVSSLQ